MTSPAITEFSKEERQKALDKEGEKFRRSLVWLEESMPSNFFEELTKDEILLVTHSLVGFDLQGWFSAINLPKGALVLCADSEDADIRILSLYKNYGIKYYRTYPSKKPLPHPEAKSFLRVASIEFTEAVEGDKESLPEKQKKNLFARLKQQGAELSEAEFEILIGSVSKRFIDSLKPERLSLALEMGIRAKSRDHCQYELHYNEDWKETGAPSLEIILAWRNTPKHGFLYELAMMIARHGLVIKTVNATYLDPYSRQSILLMALELHGAQGEAVWNSCALPDFLRELVTLKYFDDKDLIDTVFTQSRLLTETQSNLLRAMHSFIHQALVHVDPYIYSFSLVEEALCRHPDLTIALVDCFGHKFDPGNVDLELFAAKRKELVELIEALDTGHEANDMRRKDVLRQGMSFVDHTLKTNFYRNNKTALSFRLDPAYLDLIPFDRKKKFHELPYAIFFVRGMRFFAFHIRFKELSRGGLRTVLPEEREGAEIERNHVFTECYNLAYTQQKKNKDIPEGGSKAVIFLLPYDRLKSETAILKKELEQAEIAPELIEEKITTFKREQKLEYLHQAQRSFIESLLTIINCDPDGTIRAKNIVDYWKKPEYLYLGPDENMHDDIILWIAEFSEKYGYKPGSAFISSKPNYGINHKQYGVTSKGVHVYVQEMLKYLGIDPTSQLFTVKMSGGPDGDVAGNEIVNLYESYPKTAKLLALTDGSGTAYDPQGLNLEQLTWLFKEGKAIAHYPPEMLSEGGFLLDKSKKRAESAVSVHTLCWRKREGHAEEHWISGSEMNSLLRYNVHKTKVDLFIPAGGRPRTLNEKNIQEFLDNEGKPTARAIIEGANLYLTNDARRILEDKGVLIIKDSSANKGGVICSSFEVLAGLTLKNDEVFLRYKEQLVKEILKRLEECAYNEASLLLKTHSEEGTYLTDISDRISQQINRFTYELLNYLDPLPLPQEEEHPMNQIFLSYALPTLRHKFKDALLKEIPDHHKKAIIACHVAARLVYSRGIHWFPSIRDIWPLILADKELVE